MLWQNPRMDTGIPTIGHVITRWLDLHGLDAQRLFAAQGLSPDDLRPHSRRVPSEKWERIIEGAFGQLTDHCAGLSAARCWHPSDLGALGYAWLASSTLRDGFQRMARYIKIVGQRVSLVAQDTPQGLCITLQQKRLDPMLAAEIADFSLSMLLDMCRVNAGTSLRPVEVTLKREMPDCVEAYADFYGCEVSFSAATDSFTLAVQDVDRPLPTANRQLAGVHDEILAQELATLQKDDIAARCKAILLEQLTTGEVSIDGVAKALHMSPRTLTRRLASQGTQLQSLLDETRRDLAERYFADPGKSISDVAFLLGFSQQSSLARAFKRWFGVSPKAYRASHPQGRAACLSAPRPDAGR
jgi:AraC-like DNA-binding protein